MTTTIQYFGMLAEQVGKSSEQISFEVENEQIALQDYFEKKYPILKDLSYKIAVDQELIENPVVNKIPGEIALLPPFAGG